MYDFAVIGLGIYGSAIAYQLARRGYKVVGFDRHNPPHTNGSSHGDTRIFRRVPFEGAPYIDLMAASIEEIRRFERETGQTFMFETGGIDIAWKDDVRMTDVPRFCKNNNLPFEILDSAEVRRKYPLFNVPEGMAGIVQPYSGTMRVESLWQAFLSQAEAYGFEKHVNAPVQSIAQGPGDRVLIRLDGKTVEAERVIVTLGSFLPGLIPQAGALVKTLRQLVAWFDVPPEYADMARSLPVFTFKQDAVRRLYGIPAMDGKGIKLGWHNVYNDAVPADPLNAPAVSAREIQHMQEFMRHVMPSIAESAPVVGKCIYTSTSDENFIIDRAPAFKNVYVLSCCSGHGFKFTAGISKLFTDSLAAQKPDPLLSFFATWTKRQAASGPSPDNSV